MRLLKKIGTLWHGAVYRANAARRAEHGIHRGSMASRRSCANCLSGPRSGSRPFKRCDTVGMTVHRLDICPKFVLKQHD